MTWTRLASYAAVTGGLAIFSSAAHPQAMEGHTHDHAPVSIADVHDRHGTVQAELSIQPQAGERVALAFTLTNEFGEPIEDLITHHARKLHVVIISADMQVIGHIHPQDFAEPIERGEATVYFTFPRPGDYIVAADVMTETGPYAEQFIVKVAGEEPNLQAKAVPAVAVVELEDGDSYTAPVMLDGADAAQGYEVSLARPDRVKAGEPATLTFRFARGGAPVTDLRAYLDAPLHLAVVKRDFGVFLHKHGTVAGKLQAGQNAHRSHDHVHGTLGHGDGAHRYQGPATFGPEVTATFSFPVPGRYYLFAQVAHGEGLLISRFPVQVR